MRLSNTVVLDAEAQRRGASLTTVLPEAVEEKAALELLSAPAR